MSLERAIDDQRLMDQIYATLEHVTEHYDIIIIGSGAGGGTMAHALARHRRAHPDPRARRLRAAGRRELESGGGLEGSALPRRTSAGSTSAARSSRRTRTTTSAATRSSGAACSTGCGARTSRRSQHVDGVSPAWPIDYDTLAPYYDRAERLYQVRGAAGVDPTEPPRGAVSVPAGAARGRHGGHRRRSCGRWGCIPRRCRSGCSSPGEPGGCSSATPATRSPAGCTRRAKRTLRRAARRTAYPNVTLWTNALRAPADHRRARPPGRGGRSRARRRDVRVEAPLVVVVVRRRQLRGAAAAVGDRRRIRDGLANSSGLVGRRYMAHLATMMQGFHPLRRNADGVPEDGGDQRLLPCAGRARAYPLGQIQSQGRTHGVMAQTVVPWIPLWAYDAWVSRGVDWLVMSEDLPDPDNRVTRRRATAASGSTTGRTTSRRTSSSSSETAADPAAARLLDRR